MADNPFANESELETDDFEYEQYIVQNSSVLEDPRPRNFQTCYYSGHEEPHLDRASVPTKLLVKWAIKGKCRWVDVVQELMSRALSKRERCWIIDTFIECGQLDPQFDFTGLVDMCTGETLKSIITKLTKSAFWKSVVWLFLHRRGEIDNDLYMWIFNEIVSLAPEELIQQLFQLADPAMPGRMNYFAECKYPDMELCLSKITVIVSRGMWDTINNLLSAGAVTESVKKQIVDAAVHHGLVHRVVRNEILPKYATDAQLESVLVAAVNQDCWDVVSKVLDRMVTFDLHLWAVEKATERCCEEDFTKHILLHCSWSLFERYLLEKLKSRTSYEFLAFVLNIISAPFEYVYTFVLELARQTHGKVQLLQVFDGACIAYCFSRAIEEGQKDIVQAALRKTPFCYIWDPDWCEALIAMATYQDLNCPQTSSTESGLSVQMAVFSDVVSILESKKTTSKCIDGSIEHIKKKITKWNKALMKLNTDDCIFSSKCLEYVYKMYVNTSRNTYSFFQESADNWVSSERPLLYVFACVPLLADLQNEALKIVVREGRWEVIRHANLFYIWESVRRVLFREAVDEGQWALVSQLADHTLYDDQRILAAEDAYIHKQWDVMLKIADFGLTEVEKMHVYKRLLLHADMQTIHKIVERVDIGLLIELCGSRGRKMQAEDIARLMQMESQLVLLQERFTSCLDSLETVLREKHWGLALFRLRNQKRFSWKADVSPVIKAALAENAHHVVKAVLTLEPVTQAWRDSLLPFMTKHRHWAACRALLEGGVSVALCEQVLPRLKIARQWLLLARLLEYDLSTQSREIILNFALDHREGTVVVAYLQTMQKPLTAELRQEIAHRSVKFGVWQALGPLVQYSDHEGLKLRDKAMKLAIENNQWDLVDCCLHRGADLDNYKDENGLTFLQIRAMDHAWNDVEKLIVRGSAHDMYYISTSSTGAATYTILHRAIEACRWNTTKLLIQFYGDLNKPHPKRSETPLQMLIDLNRADLIDEALFWGSDVLKGVTKSGKNTLHASCEAGCWEVLYYLIARGVDPLSVTENGQSVLMCAVLNSKHPERMVAECIRLGLSTYQPHVTETQYQILDRAIENKATLSKNNREEASASPEQMLRSSESFSPFQQAVFRNLPEVGRMLYESGACSYQELWRYCTDLANGNGVSFCHHISTDLPYLQNLASTPRTLQSSCRLVISHQISEQCKRCRYQRNVLSLLVNLPQYFGPYRCTENGRKWMKWNASDLMKYLQFHDLTQL